MFKYKRECDIIPTGWSWTWVGGPVIIYMNKDNTWRLRLRIRFYVRGRILPGFLAESLVKEGESCRVRGIVWNPI